MYFPGELRRLHRTNVGSAQVEFGEDNLQAGRVGSTH
jgi:hypothetical protein